ncbi:chromosome segregation protein SMC [Miniphocaeibacter halophilus]|uniref:Chromosome segregation protein SMC n=1 Tax=Miniphocaeibacter halophilus TaxID=2931922 RepID=A0AC61MSX2_9FIRM|nr:chromosome segregation protein SMC [Miniphocaeibacter halophilus]QQK07546.1 chromosome segregation protein SMC [Miniphocaeibacter halophilus]
MKLQSIEIQGFKSFKDKIKLQFNKPICAIVGPNGSGKSNISDAIRWVLGEQSVKSLRGSKMEDVIFSGTNKYKPLNFAQVSLNFDNIEKWIPVEYSEVNITRRVFRTGESEYYINKKPCRLKDIREIFMDTGIGKEGYSIIGQGRIDEILSSKSEDRRFIFEEASGISKYKYKKEESLKKLDKTISNLGRIEDILNQKVDQRDYLKEQSDKAKIGLELTNEIKLLDLYFNKLEIEKSEIEISKNIKETSSLKEDINKNKNTIESLNEEINLLEKEVDLLKEKYESLQLEYSKLEKNINDINLQVKLNEEKIKYEDSEIIRLKEEEKYLLEKENTLKIKIEKNIKQQKELEESIKEISKKIEDYNIEKNTFSKKLEENKEILKKLEEDKEIYTEKLKNIEVEQRTEENIENTNREKIKNNELIRDKLLKEIEALKDSNNLKRNELKDVDSSIDNLISNIKELEEEINNLNSAIEEKNNKKSDTSIQIKDLTREFLFYKNIIENYEGYNRQVSTFFKKIKNSKLNLLPLGTLAELINVEEKYSIAINNVLSGTLQNIVVDTENDAKVLIDFLKKEKIGRLTFLPLNKIKGRNPIPKFNDDKILSIASEIIECDDKYKSLINYFLGKTILVTNIDDAIIISKKYKQFRVVSLDGDIFNSWGSVIGGYSNKKKTINIINRKKNLDIINSKLEELKREYSLLENEITQLQKKLIIKKNLYNEKNKNLEKFFEEKKIKEKNIEEIKTQIFIKENSLNEIENSIKEFYSKSKDLKNIINVDEIKEELEKIKDNYNVVEEKIIQTNSKINYLDLEIIKEDSKLEAFKRDLGINDNNRSELKNELEDTDNRIRTISNNIVELTSNLKNRKEKLKVDNYNLDEVNNKAKLLEEIIPTEKSNYELQLKLFLDKKDEVNDLKNISSKLEYNLDIINNKIENLNNNKNKILSIILEEYNVFLEKFTLVYNIDNKSKSDLKKSKTKLKELGYFSTDSIEEYKIINDEVEFLTAQKEDLLNSKDDIENIIKNLDIDMKKMFAKSFEEINIKFNDIFHILFDGGHASLEIQDNDILNGGIDIVAEPPGKKLQNLSLLSGGERALTAVALLFAIFETSPSPFCILDEIDAALDEANISRYTKYLKSFTDTTQFIMISHRKTTMEIADILYGVSMEEEGVSKVISLEIE